MMHQWALSISQDNAIESRWLEELANSKTIKSFEYSCGRFPSHREIVERTGTLAPWIQSKKICCGSLHLPFYWGAERPTQPFEVERQICVQRHEYILRAFAPLGMKHVTTHVGYPDEGQSRLNAVECARKTFQALIPAVQECGVSLNLEICPRGSTGGVPEEMEQLLEGMPDCIGICFDVNHAGERWQEIPQWISRLGKRIRTFHICDCDGVDECHWFPGNGILNWKEIMKEIQRLDHECLLIYEVSTDGFKPPEFENRKMDPHWFISGIERNIQWLSSLA